MEEIHDYIAEGDPIAAEEWIERILETGNKIGEWPQAGRVVPERGRVDIREVMFEIYRIMYRIREDSIRILSVFSGRRMVPKVDLDA